MTEYVKVSGGWRETKKQWVKVSGSWREVKEKWTKVNGVWRSGWVGMPNYTIIIASDELVYLSNDAGKTWKNIISNVIGSSGRPPSGFNVAFIDGSKIWLASQDSIGVFFSPDKGSSWTYYRSSFETAGSRDTISRICKGVDDSIIAFTTRYSRSRCVVYLSNTHGETITDYFTVDGMSSGGGRYGTYLPKLGGGKVSGIPQASFRLYDSEDGILYRRDVTPSNTSYGAHSYNPNDGRAYLASQDSLYSWRYYKEQTDFRIETNNTGLSVNSVLTAFTNNGVLCSHGQNRDVWFSVGTDYTNMKRCDLIGTTPSQFLLTVSDDGTAHGFMNASSKQIFITDDGGKSFFDTISIPSDAIIPSVSTRTMSFAFGGADQ